MKCRMDEYNATSAKVSYHYIIESVPLQIAFRDHSCSDQRANGSPKAIRTMQKPQQLVSILHIPYPSIPTPIFQTVAKSG